jgi:hypothetical protein
MNLALIRAILSVLLAIANTATMDAAGLANFSALTPFPLIVLLWAWERDSRISVGFVWGTPRSYLLALAFPLLVVGSLALTAYSAGVVDSTPTHWAKSLVNLSLTVVVTIPLAILTEGGIFQRMALGLSRPGGPDTDLRVNPN